MKIIDPWQPKSKMQKIWESILLGLIICIIVVISAVPLAFLFFWVVLSFAFQERPYEVHHPAIYSVQENFFQLGDNIYYMDDEYCLIFDNQKETRQINLEYISDDFYVSNDILYIYFDKHIYAYNSDFEKTSIYDTGFIPGVVGKRFIVSGDYIYFQEYNNYKKKYEFCKYSMVTQTKDVLDWDGLYPAEFISEGVYYNGIFHKYDENIHWYRPSYSNVFYNEDYEKIELNQEKDKIVINDKSIDFEYPFVVEGSVYINSKCFVFSTYTQNIKDCSQDINQCISQLTDVKLWKYDIKTGQLSLIKQFNDYTILISFDENNYHYYYDGKLYTNDIEVEEAPKIEVGDIFTYYTSESPNLYRKEIRKSTTHLAYISGEFYVIHEENNSDLEEFHEH